MATTPTIPLLPGSPAIDAGDETLSGLAQIRLRFKLYYNNNAIANYLSLYSGNAPTASKPQLIIEYYVP